MRIGFGHDTHRLVPGKPLVLGGVVIPHPLGPDAHSDGDVLLHALTDAILGAAGCGDIGEWFPDTDPKWKDASSDQFVIAAVEIVRKRGWTISNIDCTVFAQRPKLKDHKSTIESHLAEMLDLPKDAINVKAKTGERVGPIGREEAIAADAVCLLISVSEP